MKLVFSLFFAIWISVTLVGCKERISPDDGLKLRLDLDEISPSLLKQFNYHEIANSGAYMKGINDTIIAYENADNSNHFIARHAIFKYTGDTATTSLLRLFKAKGFTIRKIVNKNKKKYYLLKDRIYKKNYCAYLTNMRGLVFDFPDIIPDE